MIDEVKLKELFKKYGLHRKASIVDLPATVLLEHFTVLELEIMVAQKFFGNHFEALKLKDIKAFRKIDHEQWDMTLSHLAGQRVCGKVNNNGECPFPLESNLDFWKRHRRLKMNI